MPVILDPDGYDLWLDPEMTNVVAASELLTPYDARLMRCYPVSTRINHVANDDEACSAARGSCSDAGFQLLIASRFRVAVRTGPQHGNKQRCRPRLPVVAS
jgi:hypothetical protein